MYRSRFSEIREIPLTDKNIVLDLDQTLIHSHEKMDNLSRLGILRDSKFLPMRDRTYVLRFEDGGTNWGIVRPHAEDFLVFCFSYFKHVIVWSAGTEEYVDLVVDYLFRDIRKPDLVYSREDCTLPDDCKDLCKPLTKLIHDEPWLGLTEKNTYFLDDMDYTFRKNERNAIHIPGFDTTTKDRLTQKSVTRDDDALKKLTTWFMKNRDVSDVRLVDKTHIFDV
jgi:TFIIF-interacting CTD phosphatase-like protein